MEFSKFLAQLVEKKLIKAEVATEKEAQNLERVAQAFKTSLESQDKNAITAATSGLGRRLNTIIQNSVDPVKTQEELLKNLRANGVMGNASAADVRRHEANILDAIEKDANRQSVKPTAEKSAPKAEHKAEPKIEPKTEPKTEPKAEHKAEPEAPHNAPKMETAEIKKMQRILVLEIESALSSPKAPGPLSKFIDNISRRGTTVNHAGADMATKTEKRTLRDIVSDLRNLTSANGYEGLELKEAKFGKLSPSDALTALHNGFRIKEDDFRHLNDRLSRGTLDAQHLFLKKPKTVLAMGAVAAYTATSLYTLENPSLGTTPVVSLVPYTMATEYFDKAQVGADGKIRRGFEDFPPQVDWEIKKAENQTSGEHKRLLMAAAYEALPNQKIKKDIFEIIGTQIGAFYDKDGQLKPEFKKEVGKANEWQRIAGNAFIDRYTSTNTEMATSNAESLEQQIQAERAKVEAASSIAPAGDLGKAFNRRSAAPEPEEEATEELDGKKVDSNLTTLRNEGYIKGWEYNQLKEAWIKTTKAPVAPNEEMTAKNVATNPELVEFTEEAMKILRNPEGVGRTQSQATTVKNMIINGP